MRSRAPGATSPQIASTGNAVPAARSRDPSDDLAANDVASRRALPGDDEVGSPIASSTPSGVGDQVEAGHQLGAEGGQPAREAAGSAGRGGAR